MNTHPLLNDLGGMAEIYTLDELLARVKASTSMTIDMNGHRWINKWLQGVSAEWDERNRIYHIYYYHTEVAAYRP